MPNNMPLWVMPPRVENSSQNEPAQPSFGYADTFTKMLQNGFENGMAEKIHYVGQGLLDKVDSDDIPLTAPQQQSFEKQYGIKLSPFTDAQQARILIRNQQRKLSAENILSQSDTFGKNVVAKAGYLTGQLAQVPAILGGALVGATLAPEDAIVAGGSAAADAALNAVRVGIDGAKIGVGSQIVNEPINAEYDAQTGQNYSYKEGALRTLDAGSYGFALGVGGHVSGDLIKGLANKYRVSRVNKILDQMDVQDQTDADAVVAAAPETLRPDSKLDKQKMIRDNTRLANLLESTKFEPPATKEPVSTLSSSFKSLEAPVDLDGVDPDTVVPNTPMVPTHISNVGNKINFWLKNFDKESDILPNVLTTLHDEVNKNIDLLSPETKSAFNEASNSTNEVLSKISDQTDWDLQSPSPGHQIGGLFKTFSPMVSSDENDLNAIANANWELGRDFKMDGPVKDSLNKNSQQLNSKISALNIDPDEAADLVDPSLDADKKNLNDNFEKINKVDKQLQSKPDDKNLLLEKSNRHDLQTTYLNSAMTHDYLRNILRDNQPKPNGQDYADGIENYTNDDNSMGVKSSELLVKDEKEEDISNLRNENLSDLKALNTSRLKNNEQKEISRSALDFVKESENKRKKLKTFVKSALNCLLENE